MVSGERLIKQVNLNTRSRTGIVCALGQKGVRHITKLGTAFRWTSVTKMALIRVETLLSQSFRRTVSRRAESVKHVKCESRMAMA